MPPLTLSGSWRLRQHRPSVRNSPRQVGRQIGPQAGKPPGLRVSSSSACTALHRTYHERSAHASERSSPQPACLGCAARRDARALAQVLTLAAAELDWLSDSRLWSQVHARNGFRVPLRPRTPSRLLLIRSSAGAAPISLIPGAKLTAAPRSPPCGICPTTPHPDYVFFTWAAPYAPKCYKVQDSQALSPGRPSLG